MSEKKAKDARKNHNKDLLADLDGIFNDISKARWSSDDVAILFKQSINFNIHTTRMADQAGIVFCFKCKCIYKRVQGHRCKKTLIIPGR